MTTKEIERGRGTHFLSRAAGRTSQDTGRNRAREGHSHPVGRSGKDKSKLLKEIDRARDTHILSSAEGQVRTTKEAWRTRGTYILSGAEGGISQDTERNQRARGTHTLLSAEEGTRQDTKKTREIKRHSLPVQQGERDRSGQRKKPSQQGALTPCRAHREK